MPMAAVAIPGWGHTEWAQGASSHLSWCVCRRISFPSRNSIQLVAPRYSARRQRTNLVSQSGFRSKTRLAVPVDSGRRKLSCEAKKGSKVKDQLWEARMEVAVIT